MDGLVLTQSVLAVVTLAKVLVDMTKMAVPDAPKWIFPLVALGYSLLISLLFTVADGMLLDAVNISQAILNAILAAGAAIGVTELQKRVQ
jgi:hypothetical protein